MYWYGLRAGFSFDLINIEEFGEKIEGDKKKCVCTFFDDILHSYHNWVPFYKYSQCHTSCPTIWHMWLMIYRQNYNYFILSEQLHLWPSVKREDDNRHFYTCFLYRNLDFCSQRCIIYLFLSARKLLDLWNHWEQNNRTCLQSHPNVDTDWNWTWIYLLFTDKSKPINIDFCSTRKFFIEMTKKKYSQLFYRFGSNFICSEIRFTHNYFKHTPGEIYRRINLRLNEKLKRIKTNIVNVKENMIQVKWHASQWFVRL